MSTDPGHIYVIREREFLKTKEHIYKIGKSTCVKKRMMSYPKGSQIELIMYVPNDVHGHERRLLHILRKQCKKREDIGMEYFEVKLKSIKNIIYESFYSSVT